MIKFQDQIDQRKSISSKVVFKRNVDSESGSNNSSSKSTTAERQPIEIKHNS